MNKCPNVGMSDSDGHKSDNAALQVITANTEPCDTHDMVKLLVETEFLNL